jgi:predicted aspartyl protease
MNYEALTVSSSGIAHSIIIPVLIKQSSFLCQRFNLNSDSLNVNALLDTGATNTCISLSLASGLNLKVVGQGRMNTAGGIHETNQYLIDLLMPNNISFTNIRAMEFIGNNKFDILIGMDILTLGDLAITNTNQQTVISFRIPPDTKHIDYVKNGLVL